MFNCVLKLWNHEALTNTQDIDGPRMAQLEQVAISVLTILCHIIQAEKTIKVSFIFSVAAERVAWD